MVPTSVSQILEQIANAVVSILAGYLLISAFATDSTSKAILGSVGGTMGTAAGVLVGLLFMIFVYRVNRRGIHKKIKKTVRIQKRVTEIF